MASLVGVLIRATGTRRVLEIGTGTGESGLEMAAALPPDGSIITLERDAATARAARTALASVGFADRVTVIIGDAARLLHKVAGPFDLILQDADPGPCELLHGKLVPLLRPAGILLTRHLAAGGSYNELLGADARLSTAFLPIDGGLALSVKRMDPT